jgi:predicted amidohydrolase
MNGSALSVVMISLPSYSFVKYVAATSATRCLAFINVGNHGLASMAYGHHDQIQLQPTLRAVGKYRDHGLGLPWPGRLSALRIFHRE